MAVINGIDIPCTRQQDRAMFQNRIRLAKLVRDHKNRIEDIKSGKLNQFPPSLLDVFMTQSIIIVNNPNCY